MKITFTVLFFLLLSPVIYGQHEIYEYDSTLARQLGADEMGMKTYILVILKTGPAQIQDKVLRDSLFAGHFSNMDKLASEKNLLPPGPFSPTKDNIAGFFFLMLEPWRRLLNL
jgi:uncharacterized protein